MASSRKSLRVLTTAYSGVLVEVAVPLGSLRITPLWLVKKPRWPLEPADTGKATSVYAEGGVPVTDQAKV